jgi:hypothetical protein
MQFVARVLPEGHSEHYRGQEVRKSEMKAYANALIGLPVTLEHDVKAVSGVVTNSRVAKDGSCWILMEADNTPMGRLAEHHIDKLKWRSVSAGTFLRIMPDGTGVDHLYPYHVAIVEKPGVDGADILGIKKGSQVYVKQSQFNSKPMTTPSALPGIARDVKTVAEDPESAIKAELDLEKEKLAKMTADIAKREADLKARSESLTAKEKADRAKRIQELRSLLTTQTNQFIADTTGTTEETIETADAFFHATSDPEKYPPQIIKAFATGATKYGNVLAIARDLETRLKEANAENESLKKRVRVGSSTMDTEDRWPQGAQDDSQAERQAYLAQFGGAKKGEIVTMHASGAEKPDGYKEWMSSVRAKMANGGSDLLVPGSVEDHQKIIVANSKR